ncbi:hypoxanthine phosphoribosyltransferase [Stratiformator vulcanicus]|uniref:Hypoxanthine phosphoribosyltransferase n=1 Tax=Stratiformator vulcanicus TaxID=2527980 RepID=A0A517QXI1_9PLAN|nr:hypoxanthine phosphoribosyltransferase [Stratiformator vulcanicus]QDT36324.1 Hypoxanthine phosphoribosyltransferase [Stratiformator vulcanicus]
MKTLIEADEIREKVAELGERIATDYRGKPLTLLGVLTGSLIFLSDLMRQIELPHRVGLIQASSYRGAVTEPGHLSINASLLPELRDRDVVLVDDIFDTGHTLVALHERVRQEEPASIRSAVLLWKEGRSEVERIPDYYCFRIPDRFVVGYGLDYADEFRHLPYVAELEPEDLRGNE